MKQHTTYEDDKSVHLMDVFLNYKSPLLISILHIDEVCFKAGVLNHLHCQLVRLFSLFVTQHPSYMNEFMNRYIDE